MVFMGRGFTSGGQKSVSGFSAAACKIQASKHYIESLPSVLKDKRSCFSQGERSAVQLPLDRARLPSGVTGNLIARKYYRCDNIS